MHIASVYVSEYFGTVAATFSLSLSLSLSLSHSLSFNLTSCLTYTGNGVSNRLSEWLITKEQLIFEYCLKLVLSLAANASAG